MSKKLYWTYRLEKAKEYGSAIAVYINYLTTQKRAGIIIFKDVITSYGLCDRFLIHKLNEFKQPMELFGPVIDACRENLFGPAQHYDKSNELLEDVLEYFRNGFTETINNKEYKDAIITLETPWNIETNIIIDLYRKII